jgi:hypothetical protein
VGCDQAGRDPREALASSNKLVASEGTRTASIANPVARIGSPLQLDLWGVWVDVGRARTTELL